MEYEKEFKISGINQSEWFSSSTLMINFIRER